MKRLACILIAIMFPLVCSGDGWFYTGGEGGYTASYRASSVSGVTSGTSCEVTKPSGTADGDILIAFVNNDKSGSGTRVSTLAGWTLAATAEYESNNEQHAFYRVASSEGASYTWSFAGTTNANIVIVALSKDGGTWTAPTTDGYYKTGTADTAKVTTTAINPTDRSVLLCSWGDDGVATVSSGPADMTQATGSSGNSCALYVYYQAYASAASSVTKALTWSGADQKNHISLVLEAR